MPKLEGTPISHDMSSEVAYAALRGECFDKDEVEAYLKGQQNAGVTYDGLMSLLDRSDVKIRFASFWDSYRSGKYTRSAPHSSAVEAFGKALAFTKNDTDLFLHLHEEPIEGRAEVEQLASQMSILCQYFGQF